MRRAAGIAAALGLAAALGAACRDRTINECLEPNAQRYAFHLPGDSTMVFHWPAARMPVRVYAEPAGALPANVDSAMVLWVNAFRCNELALVRVADSAQADVIFRNPPTQPPLLSRHRFAADSVLACGGVTDGDIDTTATPDSLAGPIRSYVWPTGGDAAASEACYHFTVAHELGHALGLLDHSPNVADLMHSVPRRRLLTPDDRFTVQVLYHTAPTIVPAP